MQIAEPSVQQVNGIEPPLKLSNNTGAIILDNRGVS